MVNRINRRTLNRKKIKGNNALRDIIVNILPVVSIFGLILLWNFAARYASEVTPSPSDVWNRFILLFHEPISGLGLFGHVGISLKRVLIALLFSSIIGIILGVFIGWNRTFRRTIGTLFEIIRPIPPIAWLPLVVMLFGIGEFPKILIVFYGTLMPIVINTYTGIKMVDSLLIDVGKSFQGNHKQLLWEIAIPSSLPNVMAGLRNAVGAGWGVVLAAEMIGAKQGVGFLVQRAMEFYDPALIFVGIIAIGVVGALLSAIIEIIERRVCPWAYKREQD